MVDSLSKSWPAVGTEKVAWSLPAPLEGRVEAMTVMRLEARPYTAAIPASIADLDPADFLSAHVTRAVTEAEAAIVAFDKEVANLPVPMPAVLLRSESASSSQIERLTASARNLAVAALGLHTGDNAALVASNASAMSRALRTPGPVTGDLILDIHQTLLGASDPEIAGMWREGPVWIGTPDISPHGADFVPPTAARVAAAIDDLVEFASRPHVSPLTSAAVAHAQFETIHPFADGNGRTGRALVHTMLRDAKVTTHATVPVSAGLLADVGSYFAALGEYRQGDIEPIVSTFAGAAVRAIANGRMLAADTISLRDAWASSLKARSDSTAWRLADHLFAQPVVNSEHVESALQVSRQGAYNAIATLEQAGILTQSSRDRRNRLWQSTDVLSLMDAFASRAQRRSL